MAINAGNILTDEEEMHTENITNAKHVINEEVKW